MNPLGRCKSPLETLSTSTAQANISNCCDSRSEQSFPFPSVTLKWQDKVAAYTHVVTSVGYIYLITTGKLGSSLKHRDEPKLMIAGKPALFQICHVDVISCTAGCTINERIRKESADHCRFSHYELPHIHNLKSPYSKRQLHHILLVLGEAAGRKRSRSVYTKVATNL